MVRGVSEAIKNLNKVKKSVINQMKEKMTISSNVVADEARKICPVRTGELKRSIHAYRPIYSLGQIISKVKAEKFYGIFVELGTSRMRAQPFLSNGAKNSVSKIREIFKSLKIK